MSDKKPKSDRILFVIAVYKLVKSVLFLAAAVGVLHLLNKDMDAWVQGVLDQFHVDSDNRFADWLLRQAGGLTKTRLATISAACFFYGVLFGTEGLGLYFKKTWAEYLVVIVTASLLPLEIYELTKSVNWIKILLITGNLAILAYLIYVIWEGKKRRKG